jgi:molybdopterin molybdotransferase
LPAYLILAGEVPMGGIPEIDLLPMQCLQIHTGGMLPKTADAVVMLEYTQESRSGEVEILRSVAPGENIIQEGEDVQPGQVVIQAKSRLRPAEIGGLAALGVGNIEVVKKPRVAILSTGDEIVPINTDLNLGQVRDVNTYSLGALVELAGGIPVGYGILPDEIESLAQTARNALQECDVVVITAGSSASQRDLTVQVIDKLGSPGVLVHGVNIRPGKPTILAVCNGKPVIGLPGNPVSALIIAQLFVVPVIERLLGSRNPKQYPVIHAKMAVNLASQAGREDWVPVQVINQSGENIAEPIYGKSNLIFTLVRADGMVRIPPDATGLSAGQEVEIIIFN